MKLSKHLQQQQVLHTTTTNITTNITTNTTTSTNTTCCNLSHQCCLRLFCCWYTCIVYVHVAWQPNRYLHAIWQKIVNYNASLINGRDVAKVTVRAWAPHRDNVTPHTAQWTQLSCMWNKTAYMQHTYNIQQTTKANRKLQPNQWGTNLMGQY